MKKIATSVTKNLHTLEEQINNSLAEISRIQKKCILVKNGQELEVLESRIIQATDRLAGALLGQKDQNSIIDPGLKEEGAQFTKAFPKNTKNQGPRDIGLGSNFAHDLLRNSIATFLIQPERALHISPGHCPGYRRPRRITVIPSRSLP